MLLSLNSASPMPLVDQIVDHIRSQIDDRLLRTGMRLPPIRSFAEQNEVSRFTVVEAYDRLVALGYLQSRRGSGFYVATRQSAAPVEPRSGEVMRAFDNAGVLHQSLEDAPDRLKVGVGWLPPEWLDEEGVRRNIRTLARRADTKVTSYGTPLGYRPLRDQIQIKLGELGVAARPGQIVLTHGATQALDIVARYLLKAGDCVFVDDPGYWNLFANLRLYGVQLIGVPRTQNGPDPEALEALLAEHRPKAFFTHSVLHNPTSSNLSPANAFRVLQLAEKHDFLIVEDDVPTVTSTRASDKAGATRPAASCHLYRQFFKNAVGQSARRLPGLRSGSGRQPDRRENRQLLLDFGVLRATRLSDADRRALSQVHRARPGPARRGNRTNPAPARAIRTVNPCRTERRHLCLGRSARHA